MPTNKDFKRVVRGRMQKTGESYTAARAQLLRGERTAKSNTIATLAPAAPADFATLAGMTDEKVKKATGCNWQRWVYALDAVEAHTWPHPKIAKYIRETYKTPLWWTQTVTVGYERIKGLRVRGQQRDGTFQAQRSKTLRAPAATVYSAFENARTRRRWLGREEFTIRSRTKNKRMVLVSPDAVVVEVLFAAKDPAKALVSIELRKLASQADVVRWKTFWTERLEALATLLAPVRATA